MRIENMLNECGFISDQSFPRKQEDLAEHFKGMGESVNYCEYMLIKQDLLAQLLDDKKPIAQMNEEKIVNSFSLTEEEMKLLLLSIGMLRLVPVKVDLDTDVPLKFVIHEAVIYRAMLKQDLQDNPEKYDSICPTYKTKRILNNEEAAIEMQEYIEKSSLKVIDKMNTADKLMELNVKINEAVDLLLDPNRF